MAITFDGPTRRIILDSTSHSSEEIWSRYVDWQALNPQWPLAMQMRGGGVTDPTAGTFEPRFFFVINSWGIRPIEQDHDLTIIGYLIKEGGGSPIVRTLGSYQVNTTRIVPAAAEGIATSGSSGPTLSQIADAVWLKSIELGMSAEEILRILLAPLAGKAIAPDEAGNFAFRDVADTKNRVAGTMAEDGTREITTLDGT